MIKNNSYFYTIEEITINREGAEPIDYIQLLIKHRLNKSTVVVFTKNIRANKEGAFEELLELSRKMRKTY